MGLDQLRHGLAFRTPSGAALRVPAGGRSAADHTRLLRWIVRESAAEARRLEGGPGVQRLARAPSHPVVDLLHPEAEARLRRVLRSPRRLWSIPRADLEAMLEILAGP